MQFSLAVSKSDGLNEFVTIQNMWKTESMQDMCSGIVTVKALIMYDPSSVRNSKVYNWSEYIIITVKTLFFINYLFYYK